MKKFKNAMVGIASAPLRLIAGVLGIGVLMAVTVVMVLVMLFIVPAAIILAIL